MGLTLKPVGIREGDPIVITEFPFAVGRGEEPFASYAAAGSADQTARISRRHARIFFQESAVYLVDLGSKNGTSVNGRRLGREIVPLRSGDRVDFGGAIAFEVSIDEKREEDAHDRRPDSSGNAGAASGVTLVPAVPDSGLDPIAVTAFPLLVSRDEGPFSRYTGKWPNAGNLSRRHAYLFQKGGTVYVEDLGSTNGTFLSGRRLDERAAPLRHGDSLAFGKHFAYTVAVEGAMPAGARGPAAASAAASARDLPSFSDRTMHVSHAGSFLNIFCPEDDTPNPAESGRRGTSQPKVATEERGSRTVVGSTNTPHASFWKQLSGALGVESKVIRRKLWLGGLVMAVAAVLFAGLYARQAPVRDAKRLLSGGQYKQCLSVANRYLGQRPGDEAMAAVASEAFVKYAVPGWMGLVETQDFRQARQLLTDLQSIGTAIPECRRTLDLMEWIGGLDEYASEHRSDSRIVMFRDDLRIRKAVRWGDDNYLENKSLAARIVTHVPSFDGAWMRAQRNLLDLRNKEPEVRAIEVLAESMDSALKGGATDRLERIVTDFARTHSNTVAGLDPLAGDVDKYLALDSLAREKDLDAVLKRGPESGFATPPFQAATNGLMRALPPPDVVDKYRRAMAAWRTGATEEATGILVALKAMPWAQSSATAKLARYEGIRAEFAALEAIGLGDPKCGERLLALNARLDPVADAFFASKIQRHVAVQRERLRETADQAFSAAVDCWRSYTNITSAMHAEAEVSETYRARSELLKGAHAQVTNGMGISRLIGSECPPQYSNTCHAIEREVRSQWEHLTDVRSLLSPEVFDKKLQLLPKPQNP